MPPVTRLRHVIPVVGPSAPEPLRTAQEVTLDSIDRALRVARERVEVEVVGARFPDEPLPNRPWLVDAPVLHTSSADLVPETVGRRLPLLREVLSAFGDARALDGVVLTNIDIGLQPLFYEAVAEALASGLDAFTINRRDITPSFRSDLGPLAQSSTGARHPGSDCFVMAPAVLPHLDVGDVMLGVRRVGATLRSAIEQSTEHFRRFSDLNLTFHLGNDRAWTAELFDAATRFNHSEHVAARERHLAAARSREGVVVAPSSDRSPPVWVRRPRLIFAAATARSGTAYLAGLLGSVPGVDSAHERPPTMAGPWLRDVAAEGLSATYRERAAKVDALRCLQMLRSGSTAIADINRLFLTVQYDVVLDSFDHSDISIVDLRRDPVDIALSMDLLGWFSPEDEERLGARWRDWFIEPGPLGAAEDREVDGGIGRLDRIFLHLADVMHRRDRLRRLTPTVRWVDADLPDITRRIGARRLLEDLSLPAPPPGWPGRAQRRRVGVKRPRKAVVARTTSRADVVVALGRFLERSRGSEGFHALEAEAARWGHS